LLNGVEPGNWEEATRNPEASTSTSLSCNQNGNMTVGIRNYLKTLSNLSNMQISPE
jgi:hypothetical protein